MGVRKLNSIGSERSILPVLPSDSQKQLTSLGARQRRMRGGVEAEVFSAQSHRHTDLPAIVALAVTNALSSATFPKTGSVPKDASVHLVPLQGINGLGVLDFSARRDCQYRTPGCDTIEHPFRLRWVTFNCGPKLSGASAGSDQLPLRPEAGS